MFPNFSKIPKGKKASIVILGQIFARISRQMDTCLYKFSTCLYKWLRPIRFRVIFSQLWRDHSLHSFSEWNVGLGEICFFRFLNTTLDERKTKQDWGYSKLFYGKQKVTGAWKIGVPRTGCVFTDVFLCKIRYEHLELPQSTTRSAGKNLLVICCLWHLC